MVLRSLGADPVVVRQRRSSALGVAEQAVTAVAIGQSFGGLRGDRVRVREHPSRFAISVCDLAATTVIGSSAQGLGSER